MITFSADSLLIIVTTNAAHSLTLIQMSSLSFLTVDHPSCMLREFDLDSGVLVKESRLPGNPRDITLSPDAQVLSLHLSLEYTDTLIAVSCCDDIDWHTDSRSNVLR